MIQKQAKNRLNEEKNQNVLMKNFPIYLETEKKMDTMRYLYYKNRRAPRRCYLIFHIIIIVSNFFIVYLNSSSYIVDIGAIKKLHNN